MPSISPSLLGATADAILDLRAGQIICRVCRNGTVYDDSFLAPCSCRGEQQWVHSRCLDACRARSDDPHQCELCGSNFQLPPPEVSRRHSR
jgi:E3 ubiquitin-protein ligase DOA10